MPTGVNGACWQPDLQPVRARCTMSEMGRGTIGPTLIARTALLLSRFLVHTVGVAVRNPDGVVSGALRFESVPDATKRAEGVFIIGYPRPATSVLYWALTEHTIDDVEAIHEQVHS